VSNPYRAEKIANWVADFCESEEAARSAGPVQAVAAAVLERFLEGACAVRDVDPADIEESDVRTSLLQRLPRLDVPEDVHAGVPGLVGAFLVSLEAQGRLGGGGALGAYVRAHGSAYREAARPVVAPIRRQASKLGPNDPCPCGSGKKYKKCCRRLGRP